jgi:hypothetical protein
MADAGWGHGRPADMDTGILQVLVAYISQGGQLYGARRWADNPLTLTHVRWQGPGGGILDAFRRPDYDNTASDEERQVWVQLALLVPTGPVAPADGEAPWLPVNVEREKAAEWAQILRRGAAQRRSQARPTSPNPGSGPWLQRQDNPDAWGGGSFAASGFGSGVSPRPPTPAQYESAPSMPIRVPPGPAVNYPPPSPPPGGAHSYPEPEQWTGSWQRGQMEAPEVVVLPCVEVELPPAFEGPASAEYRKDFARDVAMHFARAARTIPQVRELRAWMRGDRLVLAARFVLAAATRAPTRAELDGAAQLLAEVLAQRTLPYSRLGFADPGEWTQGAPLGE